MRKICLTLVVLLSAAIFAAAMAEVDYSDASMWAYFETDREGTAADVFFLAPTATTGNEENLYWADFGNEKYYGKFVGAVTMQKDLYAFDARFFAPLYHEAFVMAYYEPNADEYLDAAYDDVRCAFGWYLENVNDGRPIILAGFSQGADMCIRLMKEYFSDGSRSDLLVACYAIGWHITQDEMEEYPGLRFAQDAEDTGVIVSFSCEAEEITSSLIIPEGMRALCINPLTWSTDTVYADRSLNLGACFMATDGTMTGEIPALTGAYIDPVRGALKVPDVDAADYPAGLRGFEQGIYHLYDYQFFYRNLQKNVEDRMNAYFARR